MFSNLFQFLLVVLGVASLVFWISFVAAYAWRWGWLKADYRAIRHKRSCDICFRDLQRVHEEEKKA